VAEWEERGSKRRGERKGFDYQRRGQIRGSKVRRLKKARGVLFHKNDNEKKHLQGGREDVWGKERKKTK